VTELGHFAVDEEDARRIGRLQEGFLLELHAATQPGVQREPFACEFYRRREAHRQRQLAVLLREMRDAGRLAGNARRERGIARKAGDHVAVLVEIHVARRGGRRHLAQVDHDLAIIARATDQEEPAAAQAGARRLDDGKGRRHRDRGIERIAAFSQGLVTRLTREWIGARDRRAPRPAGGNLRGGGCRRERQDEERKEDGN
jgi:hypothetical protein